MRTLYISYDGALEPLGESQVVAYLERLAGDVQPVLLSFEKPQDLQDRQRVARMEERLRAAGVGWTRLRYHKRPPVLSTLLDALVGVAVGLYVCVTRRVRIVHARSYVPALIAVALKRAAGPRFLFDMRGFWADEKVDGGHWSRIGGIYAITKRCERMFFREADGIVSLTAAGVKAFPELGYGPRQGVPVEVIPTCTDLNRFTPGPKDPGLAARLGLEGRLVVGCTGTLSNWYLREPTLAYLGFLARRLEGVKILFVTREDHDALRRDAKLAGIPADRLVLERAEFSAMPDYVRLMDLGVFFIRVCFSKKGSCATKLGEFLGCGVPVLINDGVGDSGWIVRDHGVGVVLPDTRPEDFAASLPEVERLVADPGVAARCRETARRYFDVEAGTRRYAELYRRLTREGRPVAGGPCLRGKA